MTLPIKEFVATQAVQQCVAKARILRDNTASWRASLSAGTTADLVLNAAVGIKQMRDMLAAYAATPGFNAAAREEYDDPNLTLTTEVAAVVTACDNCLTWVATNYPKDGAGYLLDRKLVGGAIESRSFTGAQMAGLVAQLDALLASFS